MVDSMDSGQLGQLFQACDLDGSGYLDQEELENLCTELSPEEIREVLLELDTDGDGKISILEFSEGFKGITDTLLGLARRRKVSQRERNTFSRSLSGSFTNISQVRDDGEEKSRGIPDFLHSLDEGLSSLSCQEQVCEVYQQISCAGEPAIQSAFEDLLLTILKDIRQQQYEKEQLETSFKRDKEQNSAHLRQLEEEMDCHMQRVENRVRKEEREKLEEVKLELKSQFEMEIAELHANLKKLEKMDQVVPQNRSTDEHRSRVEELEHENRYLKSTMTDLQTNLALIRSELASLKQQHEQTTHELDNEKESSLEYVKEHDSLTRQVHLLQNANKKLRDTNDDLRSALERTRSSHKRPITRGNRNESRRNKKRNNYVDDLISTPISGMLKSQTNSSSLAEELSMIQGGYHRNLLPSQDSCEVDSLPDDLDSGHCTSRGLYEVDSEEGDQHDRSEDDRVSSPRKRNRLHVAGFESTESEDETDTIIPRVNNQSEDMEYIDMPESLDEFEELGCIDDLEMDDIDLENSRRSSRVASTCSQTSSLSGLSNGSARRQINLKRKMQATVSELEKPITAEPERVYKVVLAGDAAVGKSSFILRLCKGKFIKNLNSTLGVDFQTKTIQVDGRVIALQLWDTAGQERFRSIAKSYFRRADGVFLLYDVTYERSFLSVRDWVEAVEDGAQKKIPIMLVGNKTDLRDEMENMKDDRCIPTEQGQKLAKEFNGLFIETSAKDGSNIPQSVMELARILRTNEDLEMKSMGMKLHDLTEGKEKKNSCCKIGN